MLVITLKDIRNENRKERVVINGVPVYVWRVGSSVRVGIDPYDEKGEWVDVRRETKIDGSWITVNRKANPNV